MSRDILSDVLSTVRLTGAIFFDVSTAAPWVAATPPATALKSYVLPGSQHLIEYHVVTSGSCWATLLNSNEAPVHLSAGSIIMFPQGDPHALSSEPHLRAEPDFSLFDQPADLAPPYYVGRAGDGPVATRMMCGFLGCDVAPFNPVIQALPRMIHIPNGYCSGEGWLRHLIAAIVTESRKERAGAESILAKLSELIFIEVVRCYMETLPPDATGWLAALSDPHLGRAIQLLHEAPKRAWTLDLLAREVGVSRTVLVNRFSKHVGVAPMTYLTNWRMQLAARGLRETGVPIARIADGVGYESEAAFSRSFKRSTGLSPGAWRRLRRDGPAPRPAGARPEVAEHA